ncbi:integrase core domain-containing protein [Pseudarthrobacter sulfonivorans]|uniref:integrase core domain-containing protein n=1 Tax=Pseudarthrobacter sulfonivorans TaxID=121292 RepID=UPI0035947D01
MQHRRRRHRVHRPGITLAERLHRILQRPIQKEQLSGEIMDTMAEAGYLAEEWKAIYNHERPHGSLDGMTPKRYWETWTQENKLAIA